VTDSLVALRETRDRQEVGQCGRVRGTRLRLIQLVRSWRTAVRLTGKLHYRFLPTILLLVAGPPLAAQAPEAAEIRTIEVEYRIGDASDVYLIWGVDDWQMVDFALWPADISVKENALHTKLRKNGDVYTVNLQIPAGSALRYEFVIRISAPRARDDEFVWDGDHLSAKDRISRSTSLWRLRNAPLISFLVFLAVGTGGSFACWLLVQQIFFPRIGRARAALLFCTNVVPVVLLVLGAEAYLRYSGFVTISYAEPKRHEFGPDPENDFVTDPLLGWIVDPLRPDINPQGFRQKKDFSTVDRESDRIRAMVLGDSFTWGVNVAAEENLVSHLEAALGENYDVFNLSAPGWGFENMFAAYQKYKITLDPDIVLLAYIREDVLRILRGGHPNFQVSADGVQYRNGLSEAEESMNAMAEASFVAGLLLKEFYFVPRAQRTAAAIIRDVMDDVRSNGGQFLGVLLPVPPTGRYTRSLRNRYIDLDSLIDRSELQFLDLTGHLQKQADWQTSLYLDDSGTHFTDGGNRHVARYLADVIRSLGLSSIRTGRAARRARPGELRPVRFQFERGWTNRNISLVWGINGWERAPIGLVPDGSQFANKVTYSPMTVKEGIPELTLRLPAGTTVDYNFQVTNDDGKVLYYDNNKNIDYHVLVK
jgi:lysophospholipase L1-like esterase